MENERIIMETVSLNAELREAVGHKVKQVKREGKIPAVLYGRGEKNMNLSFARSEFEKVYKEAGSSTIVTLKIEGQEPIKTLILEAQFNPVTDKLIHADLYKVNMKEEIHTEIPLEFVGESPAIKDLEGNMITNKDALEVKCLPDKLVSEIQVDISVLKTFDDIIKVGDIVVPEGIEILADAEEIVVQVTEPRSEEELEEIETPATADEEKAAIEGIEAAAEAEKAEGKETETEEEK